jgi:hypothetical protein
MHFSLIRTRSYKTALLAKAVYSCQTADASEGANERLEILGMNVRNTIEACEFLGEANETLAHVTNELHPVTGKMQMQASAASSLEKRA